MLPKLNRARTPFAALALALALAFGVGPALAGPAAIAARSTAAAATYSTEDVTFEHDGTTLHGTVLVPATVDERRPGVVLVAGAGARTRDAYLPEAEAFARAGVVTLIYDKRSVGYSLTQRSFAQLGGDALAGLELLRERDDVDADLVGLWGHSEGGWVVPLAASRSDSVGFVIIAGASARSPSRIQAWSNCEYLQHAGFPERLCAPVGSNLTRIMVAAGIFPEAHFDPLPAAAALDIPTLVVLAEFDRSTGPHESAELFRAALADNDSADIVVIPDADHNFRASADGFTASDGFAHGYLELLGDWVQGLPDGASSTPGAPDAFGAGRSSSALAELAWYESLPMQAAGVAAMLLAFLSYPITALARRIRGRRGRPVAAVPARILASTGLITVLGTFSLLSYLMMTGATEPLGPVALGRPVVWLTLQVLATASIVAAGWAGLAWVRRREPMARTAAVRLAVLLGGALILAPWSLYWGLLTW